MKLNIHKDKLILSKLLHCTTTAVVPLCYVRKCKLGWVSLDIYWTVSAIKEFRITPQTLCQVLVLNSHDQRLR